MLLYLKTNLKIKSCNKFTFTDIPLYFPLQQQIREDIIKAKFKVNVFTVLTVYCLLGFELK